MTLLASRAAAPRASGARPTHLIVAALGDTHTSADAPWEPSETDLDVLSQAHLVLIAGDVTDTGLPADAESVAARITDATTAPLFGVLGNHDHKAHLSEQVADALRAGGCQVLDPGSVVVEVAGARVGVAGAKGFWGNGWPGRPVGLAGEAELAGIERALVCEVRALAAGLRAIATADVRIALLHYSPTTTTLQGEPEFVLPFLGAGALATPVLTLSADLVVHGHAHHGRTHGRIGPVPVRNVALPAANRTVSRIELEIRAGTGRPPGGDRPAPDDNSAPSHRDAE